MPRRDAISAVQKTFRVLKNPNAQITQLGHRKRDWREILLIQVT